MKWLTNPTKGIHPESCGGHACWAHNHPSDCTGDACAAHLCITRFCLWNNS